MAASREAIMAALFTLLSGLPGLVTTGRRLRDPENLDPTATPALFLVEHQEEYERPDTNLPPIRRLKALALLYADAGTDQTVVPASAINGLLDAIDAALKPDSLFSGKQTLGGLVDAVVIDGEVRRASGDVSGKAMAVIPIMILLP